MKGITLKFKNHPKPDGGLETFSIDDCLIASYGTPSSQRPQVVIHLPKTDSHEVEGAFVEYCGEDYHIIGVEPPLMQDNTPTRWDRRAIAERVRML